MNNINYMNTKTLMCTIFTNTYGGCIVASLCSEGALNLMLKYFFSEQARFTENVTLEQFLSEAKETFNN